MKRRKVLKKRPRQKVKRKLLKKLLLPKSLKIRKGRREARKGKRRPLKRQRWWKKVNQTQML